MSELGNERISTLLALALNCLMRRRRGSFHEAMITCRMAIRLLRGAAAQLPVVLVMFAAPFRDY